MTRKSKWLRYGLLAAFLSGPFASSCSAADDEAEPFVVPYRSAGCGNGIREGDEQCDGADLGGETCGSVTMNAAAKGQLGCSEACEIDVSGCVSPADGTGGRGTGGSGTGGRR